MLFRAGPGFQASAGLAEMKVRQDIRRVFLEVGFKGCARFLVFVLFQEIMSRGKFLGSGITGCRGYRVVSSEPK